MSIASDYFEASIAEMVNYYQGERLPMKLPQWMIREGIIPGAEIIKAEGIGSKDRANKTDVVIYLSVGCPIKISAKLRNADYFGNWYGHVRFLQEFGVAAFERMTLAATEFANYWTGKTEKPFVGVSISFGRRSGRTWQDFTDIFTQSDILTVARGFGTGLAVANCMYIEDRVASSIEELVDSLEEITEETVRIATESFKVIYRPVNPLTEGSNRVKNVYTRFQPYVALPRPTEIRTAEELFSLGEFVTVAPNRLNHNHVLDEMESCYNIIVPRRG